MPRRPKTLPGPSHLSQVLVGLTRAPRLELGALQSLKLTLAAKNDHFGARSVCRRTEFLSCVLNSQHRHFVKEQLPSIRYANPHLDIEVTKIPKTAVDVWKPEMLLTFRGLLALYPVLCTGLTTIPFPTITRQRQGTYS